MSRNCAIVFRVDASLGLGSGHLVRCLTLARALRSRGVDIAFICSRGPGDLHELIEAERYPLDRLGRTNGVRDRGQHHQQTLGALRSDWEADAEETISVLDGRAEPPEWIIVDHYGLDHRWESAVRARAKRIMVIDDLADRQHDCDLLLDQTLAPNWETRYAGRVPNGCATLLGPRYALLQPIYAQLRRKIVPRAGEVRRILVSFGGVDLAKMTERVVSAFIALRRSDVVLDVIAPSEAHRHAALSAQARRYANIRVLERVPTLAPLIAQADLGVGAAGTTTWERLCLGLPTIVVSIAENQRSIAAELCRLDLIEWLGDEREVDQQDIVRALGRYLDRGLDGEWSRRCKAFVDGHGAERVSAALGVGLDTGLRVRFAHPADESLVLEWANDPVTRRGAFSEQRISPEVHRAWYAERLRRRDSCRFFIVETEVGFPVGQVRFDRRDSVWEISYVLEPILRGRGLGRAMLAAALAEFETEWRGAKLIGRVKKQNAPSRKIFEALGFALASDADGVLTFEKSTGLAE